MPRAFLPQGDPFGVGRGCLTVWTFGKTSSFNQKQKPILLNLKIAGFVIIWLASKERRFAIQNPQPWLILRFFFFFGCLLIYLSFKDNPSFQAWYYACLYTSDGQVRLCIFHYVCRHFLLQRSPLDQLTVNSRKGYVKLLSEGLLWRAIVALLNFWVIKP